MDILKWLKDWAEVLTLFVTIFLTILIFYLEKKFRKIQKVSTAKLFAEAIHRIHTESSISDLFLAQPDKRGKVAML